MCSRYHWSIVKSKSKCICPCLSGTIKVEENLFVSLPEQSVQWGPSGPPGLCRYSTHSPCSHVSGNIQVLLNCWEHAQDKTCRPLVAHGRGEAWGHRDGGDASLHSFPFLPPHRGFMPTSRQGTRLRRPNTQGSSATHLVLDLGELVNIVATVTCK